MVEAGILPGLIHVELQLIVFTQGPGFETSGSQRLGKFLGESMHGVDPGRIYALDEPEEVVEVRVVGEGEDRVASTSIPGG